MKRYTIKLKISTDLAGDDNAVTDGVFYEELDIETSMPIHVEMSKKYKNLISDCVDVSQQIPEVSKKGKIISVEIIDIIEKE